MPTGAFHSHYWQTQAAEPPVTPGASGAGGYPPWQTTTLISLLLVIVLGG